MATGDKVYIADKPTLDAVNTKAGTTNDTGGSTTGGSIFAKLNALISSIASHVSAWTTARAAKVDNLDAKVSTMQTEENAQARYNQLNANTSVNNTPSATGTLSQKLSHIINSITSLLSTTKRLTSKVATLSTTPAGTYTLVDVSGAGYLDSIISSILTGNSTVTVTIDGITVGPLKGSPIIAHLSTGTALLSAVSINATGPYAIMTPIYFKSSLKVVINAVNTGSSEWTAYCHYGIYE